MKMKSTYFRLTTVQVEKFQEDLDKVFQQKFSETMA